MFKPKHLIRNSLTSQRGRKKIYRTFLTLLGVLTLVIVESLSLYSSAQENESHEASFNKKADKFLKRIRRAVDEDRKKAQKGNLTIETSAIKRFSHLTKLELQPDNKIRVPLVVRLAAGAETEIDAAGFHLQSQIGDVATLDLDVDRLPELAALNSVKKIFASTVRRPLNDRAKQSVGVDNSSGQRVLTQTGKGVIVGIIDTGIDFRHRDFTLPGSGGRQTRIKALLDMTRYSAQTPDPNWNYSLPGKSAVIGHLYSEADINSALQLAKPADQNADIVKERDKNGHGTHVAGTAAGNGLSSPTTGTYAGMAPEADLIVVKASRQNDANADFETADIINALEFIRQKASELNEPFVVNLSLGGQFGPHDGTLPDERAIDNLVNGDPGRAVCIAAGNDGDSSIHARGTVAAGGSQTLDFNVNGAAYIVDLYQNKSDRFNVTVTSPDGVALGPVLYNVNGFSLPDGQASNQYIEIFNANDDKGDADPANDQPNIVVLFKAGAPDGMWKIKLEDADGNTNESYDAWAEGEGVYFSTFVDQNSHLIASPGTARGAITVGAFVTRSANQTIGAAASFTSPGPTADGRQKPELGAPGYYLYSSRSTDIADPNFGTIGTGENAPVDSTHYIGLVGTSMATPVVTGSVALLMESSPGLSADQIKDRLTASAVLDIFTGSAAWGSRLGFGKLSIANAINQTGGGLKKYSITGRMVDPDGSAVVNLQIFLSGVSSAMAITDTNGNFGFPNLIGGGNYTVTPSFQGGTTTFSPESYIFNNLNANQTANFVRTATATFSIHGRISDPNGNGVPDIRVEFPGSFTPVGGFPILPATTDTNGNYSVDLPKGQNYQVTPRSNLHVFTPAALTFTNLSANQTANFSATPLPVTINGRVTDGTDGIAGVGVNIVEKGAAQGTTVVTDANGFYAMTGAGAGQTYTVTPSKSGYLFEPPSQKLQIFQSSQPQVFIATSGNPIDNARFFVRQHYLDFLNRDPDDNGLSFWTNGILICGSSAPCAEVKRVNTSAAFFLAIEFQETGFLVYRIYKVAYGNLPGAPVPVQLNEFLPDTQQIGSGVVVGVGDWQQRLETNKQTFATTFVSRVSFTAVYATTMTPSQFVKTLYQNGGITPTESDLTSAINEFGGAGNTTDIEARARVLRQVAENSILKQREFNRAFVLMQYFAYLRRNPNSGPDTDFSGYDFWLNKLDNFNGNYIDAEMVKAFIQSNEYRKRFEQ